MGKGKPVKKNAAAATANDPDELKVTIDFQNTIRVSKHISAVSILVNNFVYHLSCVTI
jgi:hypothetical protein